MFDIRKCVNSSDNFYFFLATGYLSCCRFTDDNQILTSSGDMTWYDGITIIIITTYYSLSVYEEKTTKAFSYWSLRKKQHRKESVDPSHSKDVQLYSVDKYCNPLDKGNQKLTSHQVDGDLSTVQCHPPFEQVRLALFSCSWSWLFISRQPIWCQLIKLTLLPSLACPQPKYFIVVLTKRGPSLFKLYAGYSSVLFLLFAAQLTAVQFPE